MTVIVRVYAAERKARDAAKKLKTEGFGDDIVCVLAPKTAAAEGAAPGEAARPAKAADVAKDVAAAVDSGRLPKSKAALATENMQQGRTVLAVDAPYGSGLLATQIMDSFEPVEIAPAKSVTAEGKPRLTSEQFDVPLLWDGKTATANWFGGELTSHDYTFFKAEMLSDNPTPLSSCLKLKVLQNPKKDWKHSFGQALLSPDPTPFSRRFGWKVLLDTEKNWTASYGFPLLTSNPAPLSKLLGLPVLSKN